MRVSSGHLIRKFSEFCDLALREPVIITKNGRDRLVMISVDEYNHLRDSIDKSGVAPAEPVAKPRKGASKKAGG